MDNNKKIIDDAFTALKGPDWWALATLLGPQTACQFIPVAEIKATLCGPLGAAIEAAVTLAKDGTKVVANALGDASELLVNFTENVSGQDPPMAPEKYYQTYWYVNNHWYVLSAVVMGYSNPPDNMKVQYDHCVGYFDSHKASLDTAKKWCNKMRDQATAQLKVSLAAVKAAPPTYLESTLKPQLPALALKYFHAGPRLHSVRLRNCATCSIGMGAQPATVGMGLHASPLTSDLLAFRIKFDVHRKWPAPVAGRPKWSALRFLCGWGLPTSLLWK